MTYQEFNKKVLDYYISRIISGYCNLSLDSTEFSSIIAPKDISQFQNLKHSWDNLLTMIDNIPQYFGLVGIQCFAASLMQQDEKVTSNAYQLRLIQLLGLVDENDLQRLFRGSSDQLAIQELIWQQASIFFKESLNVQLDIPESGTYAGRFVRYPKSQALLNTEDIKHFTPFFSQEFRVKENLNFGFFKEKVIRNLMNITISSKVKKLFADNQKLNLCCQQLFNFYHTWDGEIFDVKQKKTQFNSSKEVPECCGSLILIFESEIPKFYDIKNVEVDCNQLFNLDGYTYFHNNLMLFNESSYYQDEYEDSRFIFKNTNCYIVFNRFRFYILNHYLVENSISTSKISDEHLMFKYLPNDQTLNTPLKDYFIKNSPVKLFGGIKLSYSQSFLPGFGPSISCDSLYSVICNNQKQDYRPDEAWPGDYVIRVNDYKDVKFSIINHVSSDQIIKEDHKGWDLNAYYHTDSNIHIEGCLIDVDKPTINFGIRDWINLNLNTQSTKQQRSINHLAIALNNSKK